jgi:hypothetical protein
MPIRIVATKGAGLFGAGLFGVALVGVALMGVALMGMAQFRRRPGGQLTVAPVPILRNRGGRIHPSCHTRHPQLTAGPTSEPDRWSIEPAATGSMEH